MLRKCKLFSHIAMLLIGILVLTIDSPIPANAYRGDGSYQEEANQEIHSGKEEISSKEDAVEVIAQLGEAKTEETTLEAMLDKPAQNGLEMAKASEAASQTELPEDGVAAEAAGIQTEESTLEDTFGTAEEIVEKIEKAKEEERAAREAKKKKEKEEKIRAERKIALDESRTAGRTLKKRKEISLSARELDCLQRIVQAEAGNEDIMGKLLVANVVLNRYRSEKFPDSIEEIVTQTSYGAYGLVYQFTPTRPGGGYWSAVPSEETKEAVERALNGEDYSEGALYFASRSGANPSHMSWFDRKLTWLFKHGNHEFYVG
ncbi:MAG: cell wall hydrolase [Lachnospiraceae bacterium]|jgi:spore germination cell wall hydrolase CwlJ-like protein|nr:cell wall hydrolase [Lachnospiraceae bacterium]